MIVGSPACVFFLGINFPASGVALGAAKALVALPMYARAPVATICSGVGLFIRLPTDS
jgi:hypothetical protein